jgi:hypothetical protein
LDRFDAQDRIVLECCCTDSALHLDETPGNLQQAQADTGKLALPQGMPVLLVCRA